MTTACQDFGVALKVLPRVHSLRLRFSIFNYVPLMTMQPFFRYLSHPSCLQQLIPPNDYRASESSLARRTTPTPTAVSDQLGHQVSRALKPQQVYPTHLD
jgi:hypothetical protein